MADAESAVTPAETLHLATDIVSAFVSNNAIGADKIAALLQDVHNAVAALASGGAANAGSQKPAVAPNKSITNDYIICLEDGKKLKMLKRYLRTQYGLSPDDYRRKWGLPGDYPMVAPNYAKRRSEFAKQIGLGRVGGRAAPKKKSAKAAPAKRRGRPRKAA